MSVRFKGRIKRISTHRLSMVGLALALGWLGILFLRTNPEQASLAGVFLLLAAGGIFAVWTPGMPVWPAPPDRVSWTKSGLALMLGGGICAAAAGVLFWIHRGEPTQFTGLPLVFWLAGLVLFMVGIGIDGKNLPRASNQAAERRGNFRLEVILLAVLCGAALVARAVQIDVFPNGCQSDECNNGMDALAVLSGAPYTPYAETNEGQATLFTYLLAGTFRLFGAGVPQMRLVSAVIGTLTILAFYFLARDWTDWRAAMTATALFALSRWHLTFSRIVYELILTPLVEILLFFFLLRAVREGRRRDWAAAGLCLALGLNTYTAFRVIPFAVVIFLVYGLLTRRHRGRTALEGILVFTGGAAIGVVPLAVYALQNWSIVLGRTQHISVFTNIEQAGGSLQPLWDNLVRSLLMFHWKGDWAALNNLPDAPLLDPLSGVLFVFGLIYALRHIRHPLPFLMVDTLLLVFSLAVFSSSLEAPTARRSIGLLPVIFFLVGMALDRIGEAWRHAFARERSDWPPAAPIPSTAVWGLASVVLAAGWLNLNAFFNQQARHPAVWRAFSATEAEIGRYMRRLDPEDRIYLANDYLGHSAVEFISSQRAYTPLNLSAQFPVQDEMLGDGSVVYILGPVYGFLEPLFRQVYPDGLWQVHRDPFGEALFISCEVPSTALDAANGLQARYYAGGEAAGEPQSEQNEASLSIDWTARRPPIEPPFTAVWEGSLLSPEGGDYQLVLAADGDSTLWIDDREVITLTSPGAVQQSSAQLALAGGFHRIKLEYHSPEEPGQLDLAWKGPNIPTGPIPPTAYYPVVLAQNGLVGYTYPNGEVRGEPAFIHNDIFIEASTTFPPPYSIVWRGQLAAPRNGLYTLGVRADDGALVFINGERVVDNGGSHGSEYREGQIQLAKGLHPIEIRYWELGGSRELQLSWVPPGGTWEVIPPGAFFPEGGQAFEVLPAPGQPHPSQTGTAAVPLPPDDEKPQITAKPTIWVRPDLPPVLPVGPLDEIPMELIWEAGSCGRASNQFLEPHGAAVDIQGNLYVADTGNRRVVILESDGAVVGGWGTEGEGMGQFLEPVDLAVAPDGTVVVLDAARGDIQRFDPAGGFLEAIPLPTPPYRPRGMGANPSNGNLWVADTGNTRIVEMDPKGNLVSLTGTENRPPIGEGQPTDVLSMPDGSVWLVEPATGTLWHLAAGGSPEAILAMAPSGTVDGPHLAAGEDGTLYITDPEGLRVVVVSSTGEPVGQFGAPGGHLEGFQRPVGIAVDGSGRVIVVDTPACKVKVFAGVE